jgi:hypothetical protein
MLKDFLMLDNSHESLANSRFASFEGKKYD